MPEPVQPIVLVGGKSRRFGRDKLREPFEDGWLVDRPIRALRGVFGPRVAAVGACDPEIAARADAIIADRYPGVGPIGGIVSALEHTGAAVFVLPGDLPGVTPEAVGSILRAASESPAAWAVLAGRDDPEPCVGIYRQPALEPLRALLRAGRYRLRDALPRERAVHVAVPAECLWNANTPEELGDGRAP